MRLEAGEELIEHGAERVHVGGGRDGRARHLLGACIVRREQFGPGSREIHRERRIERLRDAEVHELDRAVRCREDVARLEIAVDDQAPVGGGHRIADVTEDSKPRPDVQLVVVAVAIDPHPLHVLHREIRKPLVGEAAVEELRDAGMRQPGQDLPLGHEARALMTVERTLNHLQRHVALVLPVGPSREVDGSHPAAPDLAHDGIWTNPAPGPIAHARLVHGRRAQPGDEALERPVRTSVRVEQRLDLEAQRHIVAALGGDERGSRMIRLGERLLEQQLEACPRLRRQPPRRRVTVVIHWTTPDSGLVSERGGTVADSLIWDLRIVDSTTLSTGSQASISHEKRAPSASSRHRRRARRFSRCAARGR